MNGGNSTWTMATYRVPAGEDPHYAPQNEHANPAAWFAQSACAEQGWGGLYETENAHRAWAVRVTSEAPFNLRIVAGHLANASERVDATALGTKRDDGSILFERGPDCAFVLTKTEFGVHVDQVGSCKAIGFPVDEDLSLGDTGQDFPKVDELKECFDVNELSIGTKGACNNAL